MDKKAKSSKASTSKPATSSAAKKGTGKKDEKTAKAEAKGKTNESEDESDEAGSDEGDEGASTGTAKVIYSSSSQSIPKAQLGVLKPSKSLEVTLFDRMERMWGNNIKQMLDVQYRSVYFTEIPANLIE